MESAISEQNSGLDRRVQRLAQYQRALGQRHAQIKAIETRWSWARLLAFLLTATIWIPFEQTPTLAGLSVLPALALFVWTVQRHLHAKHARVMADQSLTMASEAYQRLGGTVVAIREVTPPEDRLTACVLPDIADDGPTWCLTGQEHDDLDLFHGPVGVFGLLNRTSTDLGARRLGYMLGHPLLSAEHIRRRQESVRWLEEHLEQRCQTMAAAAVLRKHDRWLARLVIAIGGATALPHKAISRLMRIWSGISLLLTVWIVGLIGLGRFPFVYALMGLAAINGLCYLAWRRKLGMALDPWKDVVQVARGYLLAAREAADCLPDNAALASLQDRFKAVIKPEVLPALCGRLGWADSGGAFRLLFNVMYFYDLHVAEAILGRAVPNQDNLIQGFAALAELESLNSLACFAYEQPTRCYAEMIAEPRIDIKSGYHPLIQPEEAVANRVRLDEQTRIWIITGSNMAGKSTFLRMVGVNLLLAQIGTVSTTDQMILGPVRLMTDLQVRDNLSDHESYFLAEVRHLRRMLDPPKSDVRLLGLMDEPFRGTNSDEQVAASLAVVEHLRKSDNFYVVATHEKRVTDLANDPPAANHHFQEDLNADGMVFDYQLRPGPALTRNALRVLEREGYPAEILKRANRWVEVISAQHKVAPIDQA